MWLGSKGGSGDTGGTSGKESLFADLFQEVKCAAPSAQLSYTLRCRLERCDRETRSLICERTKDGCSPLFVACKKGNVEVRQLLIKTCVLYKSKHVMGKLQCPCIQLRYSSFKIICSEK